MPGTYPPPPPTLSGDLMTIHRLLQSPTQVRRRLRTFLDLRFVSDRILTQRFRTSGGAISYEVSEPIVNTRTPESVAPGSEYPRDTPTPGTGALAGVQKWGQASPLTDENIKRSVYAGDEVDRTLRKAINTVIKQVDGVTVSAVGSAVTATLAAIGSGSNRWSAESTARMLRDLELARAAIIDLNQGYMPDTLLLSTSKYGLLASDQTVAAMRRREATDNPDYAGEIEIIDGLVIVKAPLTSLPSDDVWVLDSKQLGGMADEAEVDPGYAVSDMGVQVQSERIPRRDMWDIWARRLTVPVIQEPGAAIKITST